MATLKVVLVEPGKSARIAEIGSELEDLQAAVGGGLFEAFSPFDEEVCIVCNEEGKVNGMKPCRAIRDRDEDIADIIYGPFFVCSCGAENFKSLSEEQLQKYLRLFSAPEAFISGGKGRICVIPYSRQKRST